MWLSEFGANGPAYYLGCWLSEACKSNAENRAWKPAPAEVRACLDRGKPDIQYNVSWEKENTEITVICDKKRGC